MIKTVKPRHSYKTQYQLKSVNIFKWNKKVLTSSKDGLLLTKIVSQFNSKTNDLVFSESQFALIHTVRIRLTLIDPCLGSE